MTAKKMGHLPTTKMVWTGLSTYSHNYTERKSNKGRPECAAEATYSRMENSVEFPGAAVRGDDLKPSVKCSRKVRD